MDVKITKHLEGIFFSQKTDTNLFIKDFLDWKLQGDIGEYESPLFGKDSAYTNPPVNGKKYTLRHVHLPPILDMKKLEFWLRNFERRGRKTSDRVLIYAKDEMNNYLLITILDEPDAHEIAKMETKNDKRDMIFFAEVAEEFIYHKPIIF
jgi:mRNA interferase YafO